MADMKNVDPRLAVILIGPIGAGKSTIGKLLAQRLALLQHTIAPFPNVILLLPSPNVDESAATLRARLEQDFAGEDDAQILAAIVELNDHFLRHPSNARLATAVVYTNGRTPEETCEAVISLSTGSGSVGRQS